MKLAVFTGKYPARIATFFERDMRALIEAGLEIDVFAISPLNPTAWEHALDLLGPQHLPRERVHHLTLGAALKRSVPTLRKAFASALGDAFSVVRGAVRHGPVRVAKTVYLLPKAWAWAAEHANQYDHVLGYWGNYAGTCAYLFHRLAAPHVPFSMWLHAGTDLYRGPVFMEEKLTYADNVITCCEFNQGYILKQFAAVPGIASKPHLCHHGLHLADFPHRLNGRAPNRLLAVGRLAKQKGFDYLVRAAQVLRDRGVDVIVEFVGDGEERPVLQTLAAQLGVADRVEFLGWQPRSEEHTSELQSPCNLVCRLLLEKKKNTQHIQRSSSVLEPTRHELRLRLAIGRLCLFACAFDRDQQRVRAVATLHFSDHLPHSAA